MIHKLTRLGGISATRRLAIVRRLAHALLAPLTLIPLLCVSAPGQTSDLHSLAGKLRAATMRRTQVASVAAASTPLIPAGSMAQIASAGGWDTSLTLVNFGTTAGEALLNFYANDGSALELPFTFPQQASPGRYARSSVNQTLNANATLVLDTTGPSSQASAAVIRDC